MPFGFNFRNSAVYVTDPANTASITSTPTTLFPSVRTVNATNYSVGYVPGTAPYVNQATIEANTRNRVTNIDPRLCGTFQVDNGSKTRFVITLPSTGTYDINLASGDALHSTVQTVRIYDGVTLLATLGSGAALGASQFMDATGVVRSPPSDWVTNNAARRLTFSTTEFRIETGAGSGGTAGNNSTINHVSLNFVPPVAVIDTINGGAPIRAGQTSISVTSTGFTAIPTSVVCQYASGTRDLICTNIAGTANNFTFDIEDRSNGVDYPAIGDTLTFTFTSGSETAQTTATLTSKLGETAVTLTAAITDDTDYIGYMLLQDGYTAEGGEFVYQPYGDLVVNADSGYDVNSDGDVVAWFRPATGIGAGNVYEYTLKVREFAKVRFGALSRNSASPIYDYLFPLGNRP